MSLNNSLVIDWGILLIINLRNIIFGNKLEVLNFSVGLDKLNKCVELPIKVISKV